MDETLKRLIARRRELGLSQLDIANRLGVGQSRVSVIESGAHDLLPGSLADYAHAVDAAVVNVIVPKDTLHRTDAKDVLEGLERLYATVPDPGVVSDVLTAVEAARDLQKARQA